MTRVWIIAAAAAALAGDPAEKQQTFTGMITDSMCVMNHKMMKITPDEKCARECVRTNKSVKYVLFDESECLFLLVI